MYRLLPLWLIMRRTLRIAMMRLRIVKHWSASSTTARQRRPDRELTTRVGQGISRVSPYQWFQGRDLALAVASSTRWGIAYAPQERVDVSRDKRRNIDQQHRTPYFYYLRKSCEESSLLHAIVPAKDLTEA
jgi:hypothetical protein